MPTNQPQREALKQLWPEIAPWCLAHDLQMYKLLSGKWGIPLDGQQLRVACGEKLMTPAQLAAEAGMIMKIMAGTRKASVAALADFARILGCPAVSLLPADGEQVLPASSWERRIAAIPPARSRPEHGCPGCGKPTAYRWCDDCRCTGTNAKGKRCGNSAISCMQHGPAGDPGEAFRHPG